MKLKPIIKFSFVVLLFTLLSVNVAYSEHEADHRYTLKGQLLDAQNKAIPNASLKFMLGKKVIKQASTNAEGKYTAKLHLHDPDYGKDLEIIVPGGSGKVKIEFTLGDKKTERFHIANFVDGKLVVENTVDTDGSANAVNPAGDKSSVWIFIAIAVIVVLAIVIVMGDSKKKQKKKKKKNK